MDQMIHDEHECCPRIGADHDQDAQDQSRHAQGAQFFVQTGRDDFLQIGEDVGCRSRVIDSDVKRKTIDNVLFETKLQHSIRPETAGWQCR